MRAGGGERGRQRRGPAEEGEVGAGRRRRAAVGREGEREGGRDSVTLPKGVCAVRTCKRVSGLPPRARGGGVLGASTRRERRREWSEEGAAARMERRTLAARRGGEDGEANLGGEEWR